MRRRAILLASAASAAALLGGWQFGTVANPAPGTSVIASGSGNGPASAGAVGGSDNSTASSGAAGAGSGVPAASADGTYTGATVPTRFGDVQVRVTVSAGQITDVTPLQLTDHDGRSVQISNRAAPVLRQEVLQAQSASVSMVSGATYTSAAYLQSLQAALDQAGFR